MAIRAYDISTSPLTVELNTGGHGGLAILEVWVKDVGEASFTILASYDGKEGTWREIDELLLPHNGKTSRHKGFLNAYNFIKVVNTSETESEIEIIAGEM